jgi:cytochrome c peroxidase
MFVLRSVFTLLVLASVAVAQSHELDRDLTELLRQAGFTGKIESTLRARLGRPVDRNLADLGRLLFFDKISALHSDNACAGCHAPSSGFGDTQSIAIGIQNNNVVGPNRAGPRNQRRTPSVVNAAFYPKLMWNARFATLSGPLRQLAGNSVSPT